MQLDCAPPLGLVSPAQLAPAANDNTLTLQYTEKVQRCVHADHGKYSPGDTANEMVIYYKAQGFLLNKEFEFNFSL